jgi:hypothetical protein
MSVQDDNKTKPSVASQDSGPASPSRRAILRGGVVAMPAILTLQSGAALARSSNLISAASSGTTDRLGRTLCLDTNSVKPAGRHRGVYDLDDPPYAEVNIISDRAYFSRNPNHGDQKREDQDEDRDSDYDARINDYFGDRERDNKPHNASYVCQNGGTYWVKPQIGSNYQVVELPQNGVVLSSASLLSVADSVTGTLIG